MPSPDAYEHWSLQLRVSERRVLLMVGDVAASLCSVLVSLYLWALNAHRAFNAAFILPQLQWFLILPALWLLLANANDYYNLRVAARRSSSLYRLAGIVLQVLVIYLATFFFSPRGSLPRRFIVYYAALSLTVIGLWRLGRLFLVGWTGFRRRALIVGVGRSAELIWQTLKLEASADYEVLGMVSSTHDLAELEGVGSAAGHSRVLGQGSDLPQLVRRYGISELIMAYANEIPDDVFGGVMSCYEQGVAITPMSVLYEQVTGRVPIEHVEEHQWSLVLPFEAPPFGFSIYQAGKRLFDVLLALCGLVLFMLVLPLVALAIRLDSPGPVFFRQVRLGQGGRPLRVLKLRSMVQDAERGSGPLWATAHDARVTRVGRFLRKTRLDEFPQLLNVLRGEMSVVGPRPERPEFVTLLAQDIPFYRTRLVVKPGLTGWAQVRYRYGSSREDALVKLQYDLYYIRHQSLLLDVLIILKTVGTVLLFRGT